MTKNRTLVLKVNVDELVKSQKDKDMAQYIDDLLIVQHTILCILRISSTFYEAINVKF